MIARRDESSPRDTWTVGDLLGWTEGYLQRLELPTPRLDAEILLAFALGCTRIDLYTGYHRPVDAAERARFRSLVERRSRKEPVAYLCGTREFYSLKLAVSPGVLIPRPETEHLVDCALQEIDRVSAGRAEPASASVLDLGTGSGNIAIAVAVERPACSVDAVDLSARALSLARANAAAHGVAGRVRFLEGDWLAALPSDAGPYDLILSNPPYIPPAEARLLMDDVRLYEPPEALLDTRSPTGDGLGFYRALAVEGGSRLRSGGLVAVEVGAGQAPRVVAIFREAGWTEESVTRDYGGIDRVVSVRKPQGDAEILRTASAGP